MSILNLTQHTATPDQREAGVVDLPADERQHVGVLLTFDEPPSGEEIGARAADLAEIAAMSDAWLPLDGAPADATVMIGGAMWLMGPLVNALRQRGLQPVFAFSRREAEETSAADGSVRKTAVFRHIGFVEAP